MDLYEMNLTQVTERLAQLEEEVREMTDADKVNAATEEKKNLLERKKELENLEQRKKTAEEIANGAKIGTVIEKEERSMENNIEVRNSKEYIEAFANYIKTGKDEECRALITENGTNGTVPVPELVDSIVRTAWNKEGIMSLVKKSYLKGNLKVGFEISAGAAVVHAEGTAAPNEEALVLGIVTLVPESIKKWITVSDEVMDMRGEAFLQYVYEEVAYQIAKKAADELITKIEACGTTSTTTSVAVPAITEATVAVGTIAKALAELSDQAADPVIMMNKKTWASFKAVEYGANYAVDPFEGLKVLFNDTITAYTAATTGTTYAIVGDLGYGALANLPNGEEIKFTFDDKSLAEKDLVKIVGREYVGIGIVAPKAFVKIKH